MWVGAHASYTSAAPEIRNLWTSAVQGTARATATHQVCTTQSHTPRHIGCLLTKASKAQFASLGAAIASDTVTDVGGDVRMFAGLKQDLYKSEIITDMMYDLVINDSEATLYTARVYLDSEMFDSGAKDSYLPAMFHALKQLDSLKKAVPKVADVLKRALSSSLDLSLLSSDPESTSGMHCVASSGNTNRRLFPIDVNVETNRRSLIGTQTDKTVLYNANREITHNITTYSVKASDMPADDHCPLNSYLVAQNMKIEDIGDCYSANVTLSIVGTDAREVLTRKNSVTHTRHPYTSIEKDLGREPRTSVMHVFLGGFHYSMSIAHTHNCNSARSLQLPAYAALRELQSSGKVSESRVDALMKTASMETLSDFTSLPMTVARQSSEPFLCVIVPSFVKTDICKTSSYYSDTDRIEERVKGDDLCYLVDMQLPEAVVSAHNVARTLDINSLPEPVQNALRRQWGS
jgi:hypothetical protein